MSGTPMKRDAWDDVDGEIYDLRVRKHQSWRAVGAELGIGHETARRRFANLMRRLTHAEVEQMRAEEGHRLDELAASNWRLVEVALALGDLVAAQRGIREIRSIARTRCQLFGLEPTGPPAPDDDRLNELFDAYLQGVRDADRDDRLA